jgi:APA family basic amino acid/polyamine antiporter
MRAIQARLSTFDTVMVVFSLVVGIGIFRTPAIVARAAGSTSLFFTAWIAAGLVSLVGALVFAEIGSRHPRAGGYYRVVADCYHPALAFMLNWAQTLMEGVSAAGVAFIGADYLLDAIPLPQSSRTVHANLVMACAIMLGLLALNYRGIKLGSRAQNLLSMLKIALMIGLVVLALALAPHAKSVEPAPQGSWMARLTAALIPCFYAYGGYHLTMNLGADLKDARRRFPIAIAAGMLIVVALYLLLNFAYHYVLGTDEVARSALVAGALTDRLFGSVGRVVISVIVFLSAAGFINATIVQMPRTFYAMAEDGVLPRAFMRVNPDTQAQEVGLVFFGATMLLPALLLGSFEKLLDYVIFVDTITLIVVASTLFVLRRRRAGEEGFAMRGYPILPALYILALFAVCTRVASLQPVLAAAGVGILLTGWPLYRFGRKLFATAPEGEEERELGASTPQREGTGNRLDGPVARGRG